MGKNSPEQDLQISVVNFLSVAIDVRNGWFWHTPNGVKGRGKRAMLQTVVQKKMGMKPGFPDLCIAHEALACETCGAPTPIGIELKTKRGQQSDAQKAVQERFEALGWPYHICRSVEAVHDALEAEGVPLLVKRFDFGGRG